MWVKLPSEVLICPCNIWLWNLFCFSDQFEGNKIKLSSVKKKTEFFQLPALWMQGCDKKSVVLAVVLVQAWSHYFQNLLQGCVSMAHVVRCVCSVSCWGCQFCISWPWFRNNEVLLKHFLCTSRQLLAIKYANKFKQDRILLASKGRVVCNQE